MREYRQLRDCLGRFATGVTVMTCKPPAGAPSGITANSFSSVSLDPPLVLWSIARDSRSTAAFLDAGAFVVNILAEDQQSLSEHFAQSERPDFDQIEGLRVSGTVEGQPVLPDCMAYLHCRTCVVHEGGDHHILLGEVAEFELGRPAKPLIYYRGRYIRLAE